MKQQLDIDATPSAVVERGLSSDRARLLLERYGRNELAAQRRHGSALGFVAKAVTDPMVMLLVAAAATYVWLGDRFDAIVVSVALVPIFLVNGILEHRADAALEKLRELASPDASVVRDGEVRRVKAAEVVPGDLLVLTEGDIVAADGTVRPGTRLSVDESALTGESVPVDKSEELDDLGQAVLAGTKVVAGHGMALVERTGASTEYGRIGGLMAESTSPPTPIQRVIHRLVLQIGVAVGIVCVAVAFVQVFRGQAWPAAVIAGVSLAMAAVPEELPMVYTLYLALGAWRLARHKALVRRLGSVETLGTTQTICVDKTGTLTFGRLELQEVFALDGATSDDVIAAGARACSVRPIDPLDAAIVAIAVKRGAFDAFGETVYDEPFDPRRQYAATVRLTPRGARVSVKGALESVLAIARLGPDERRLISAEHDARAKAGMRVIAVAEGWAARGCDPADRSAWGLRPIGLLAFADPVRPSIAAYLRACRSAGIAVVMITGDHASTASAVARAAGFGADAEPVMTGSVLEALSETALRERIEGVRVFARIRPEQKLRIVKALRAAGQVVAMTGDGTNDALALREADIGIAMGQRGTEVAREAADLVLLDDDFGTIVHAIRDGRRIFDNLKRAFRYLVAFHAPLLISAVALPFAGVPLLLLPIHLVWLELLVHPTSSLVFESDPGDPNVMQQRPRDPAGGLLGRVDWSHTILLGGVLALAVVALYLSLLARHVPVETARSAGIATMIAGQTMLVLVENSRSKPFWSVTWTRTLIVVLLFSVASLVACLYVPPLANAMKLAPLDAATFGLALFVGTVAVLVLELLKLVFRPAHA